MKNIALILFLLFGSFTSAIAQSEQTPLTIKKVLGTSQFLQNEEVLTFKEASKIMASNEVANLQLKRAKSSYNTSLFFSMVGGALMGFPLGLAVYNGAFSLPIFAIGTGLMATGIVFHVKYNKLSRKAVATYNEGLKTASFWNKKELRFMATGNQVGFVFNF